MNLLYLWSLISYSQVDCNYQPDVESDYMIGVSDILAVLALFGEVDIDQDGIWDSSDLCVDTEACNFELSPSEECQYYDINGNCGGTSFT